jgi:hypothetical protein
VIAGVSLGGAALLCAWPAVALACSACYYGRESELMAYVGTAVLLSVLPLALVGGIGLLLYRRTRAQGEMPSVAGGRPRSTGAAEPPT